MTRFLNLVITVIRTPPSLHPTNEAHKSAHDIDRDVIGSLIFPFIRVLKQQFDDIGFLLVHSPSIH